MGIILTTAIIAFVLWCFYLWDNYANCKVGKHIWSEWIEADESCELEEKEYKRRFCQKCDKTEKRKV